MSKKLIFLFLSIFLLFSCSKKDEAKISSGPSQEEQATAIYYEALEALKKGDAFYAKKKFKEVEGLMPQSTWAVKASLMASFSDYSRNAYSDSVFGLERHINNYPADKNIPYAHYLIAMCYYEQILDEKKDLGPLLDAKKKFEFVITNFPKTDYATDASFKLDLIVDQLAAKEMSIARYYMKTEKWIPAINRLKIVVEEYEDGMKLTSNENLSSGELNSENDHRLFMAFSIAAMYIGDCTVTDPDSVQISYPNFISDMKNVGAQIIPL